MLMGNPADSAHRLVPRLIRLRDAPFYLGMDRNRFNAEVRPHLVELRIGEQGVAFDRLDLDAWVDQYKSRNGRPGRLRGETTWDAKERQAFDYVEVSGKSTRSSSDRELSSLLEQATSKKRKGI
jgi:hypothetical protein